MPQARKYEKYYDYVEEVVKKCSHSWLIQERKDSRNWRIAKLDGNNIPKPEGKLFKITPARCKSYSCPICGRKKVIDLMKRLKKVDLRGYRFFTLTLKNEYSKENTEYNLKRITECFNKLNKQLRKIPSFKGLEYFRVIEVGNDGMVHIHGLWNKYIDTRTLGMMWFKITGDSFRVKPERVKSKNDAVKYLYKYLVKNCLTAYQERDPELFGLEIINTAQLFYENGKRRYQASRNFFPKNEKEYSDYLPLGFESNDSENIEKEIKYLMSEYDLSISNFDTTYYDESDLFLSGFEDSS